MRHRGAPNQLSWPLLRPRKLKNRLFSEIDCFDFFNFFAKILNFWEDWTRVCAFRPIFGTYSNPLTDFVDNFEFSSKLFSAHKTSLEEPAVSALRQKEAVSPLLLLGSGVFGECEPHVDIPHTGEIYEQRVREVGMFVHNDMI